MYSLLAKREKAHQVYTQKTSGHAPWKPLVALEVGKGVKSTPTAYFYIKKVVKI